MPQHRNHVVGRDDAGQPAVLVDDRERDEVVLVEERGDFVLRRIRRAPDTPQDDVAALFDKYNLITLAVVDEHERLAGIITADDVITMLRHR